jgi:signal transduction histidine kinase/CheY-like chemotaxis protein
MTTLKGKLKCAISLFLFCCAYWMLDSAWSYVSFEKNLSALVFQEPMGYMDTLMLKVSPYQLVSRIMVTTIFIVTGTVIAIFIYKQKKAEEENILLERELQQSRKMESIGTLAGGIAHDFNNILYGAIGYTEFCLDDTEPGTLMHKNLEEIRSGLLRAKSLIKQILAFSRRHDGAIEPTLVAPLVKEVVQLLKSAIPSTIAIRIDADVENSTIMGDPIQIQQVVMNLCTNAVHAMEDNGGVLKITLDNVEIGAFASQERKFGDMAPGDYLKLQVSDNGVGIPRDHLDRVFDPFFTSKEQGKGSGMGLAVVHGIVKAYKGRILVESDGYTGTCFEVLLPLVARTGACKDDNEIPDLPEGAERILIVDDDARVLNTQTRLLERLGYTVYAKYSGQEVIDAVKENHQAFDVVITDMTMPEMTGDILAGKIKKIKPDLPVILCASDKDANSHATADDSGVDAILVKPVAKAALAEKLRQVLDKNNR